MIQHHLDIWLSESAAMLDAKKGTKVALVVESSVKDDLDTCDIPLADLSTGQALSELAMILAREENGLEKQVKESLYCEFWHFHRAMLIFERLAKEAGITTAQAITKTQALTATYSATLKA